MFRNTFVFILTSFLLFNCGVKEPKTDIRKDLRKITLPESLKNQSVLSLTGISEKGMSFDGSLMIWKGLESNRSTIKTIIEKSDSLKEVMAGQEKQKKERALVIKNIEEIEKYLKEAGALHLRKFLESQDEETLLEAYKNLVSPADLASKEFELFCDAKYIAFSVSQELLNEVYTERPVSTPVCEAYYKEKSYFSSASCSQSKEGKSYLDCFWTTDFLKKSNLKIYKKVGRKKVEMTDEELDSSSFQEKWSRQDWFDYLFSSKKLLFAGLLKLENGTEKFYLYFDHAQKKIKENFEFSVGSFLVESSSKEHFLTEGEAYSWDNLIFNFRKKSENKKLYAYSLGKENEKKFASFVGQNSSLFSSFYTPLDLENDKKQDELKKEKSKLAKIKDPNSSYMKEKKRLEKIFVEDKKSFDELMLNKPVAHSYWPNMDLNLSRGKDGSVTLDWILDAKLGLDALSCTVNKKPSKGDSSAILKNCSFEKNTGLLQFSIKGEDLAKIGWSLYSKTGAAMKYNFLEKEKFLSRELVFDLTYILYDGEIPMFSGDVFVKEKGEVLYQGSVLLKKLR